MSLIVEKLTTSAVVLKDLGITITGAIGTQYDLTNEQPNDIAQSALGGSLEAAINGTAPFTVPELVVVDPRSGYTGNLNATDSLIALRAANDVHFGIRGGVLGDLEDVNDPTPHALNAIHVLKGDGTSLELVDLANDATSNEVIQDVIASAFINGSDTTYVYNDIANTMQVDVNDVFLRNTGDTLDSGTLTIASGAAINVASGATLTIVDAPVNPTDAVNKSYVDSLSAGLDPKESVRLSTVAPLTGVGLTYNPTGGTGGTGAFTNVDLTNIDGVAAVIGNRILIKDQTDAKQNGIYVVITDGTLGTIERASDQDGSPSAEVSGGNFTFVEQGTTLSGSGWAVVGDGILTLNTDPIVWTQFSESSVFTAGDGLALTGSVFSLDLNNLTAATISATDEIGFNDVSAGNIPRNTTVANFLNDLNIPNNIITNGFIINNAGTYSTVSLAVNGNGALDGLVLTNADGTTGNPTLGLDIQNLPGRSDVVDVNDRVAVFNVTSGANEYYSISDFITASANNAFGVITGDTGTATADTVSDSVSFTGDGLNIVASAGANAAVSFSLDISDLTPLGAGTLSLTNEFAIDDTTVFNKRATLGDLVNDLQIPNNIGNVAGFVVSDGAGNYTTRTLSASTNEDLLGINVTPTDGSANTTVGLDIVNLTNPNAVMNATDEFAIHDKSEGTGGANRKITGQNVADGVATILGLPSGLSITTIGGQQVLTLIDTTRANKILSVETTAVTWSENRIGNNDWVQIGNANDAAIGYIVPLNATIVKVTAHTINDNNNSKNIDLYVDGVLKTANIVSFTAVNGQNEFIDVTLNVDIVAGEKLQLRGASTGGRIEDTVITIWLKWRG